ncbi:YraN family protein [uncultured Cytophaga sp.]|uniref:YraN family protein n=1 Tax=uncultured Cytophaga sp. TaxID=160238 RepID=UPI00261830F5|nr:YraN family protein [uncultured Cytophaga sp.]
MEHILKGKAGEDKACLFLMEQGYEILERNYRSGRGEIDIITKTSTCICFVEVKYRKHNKFGFPEVFVTDKKMQKIMQTAEAYVVEHNWNGRIRFDVIAITGTENPVHIMDVT